MNAKGQKACCIKRLSGGLLASLTLTAHAAEPLNLDYVLTELSRQQNNASDLVKSARQPANASLALSSSLFNQTKTAPIATTNSNDNDSDVLSRLTAVASNTVSRFSQSGVAATYGRQFQGNKTTSGDTFDQNALTAAHASLPMNCYIKVTNKSNGKSVVVKVNDRKPFSGGRVIDLSNAAAKQIGISNTGTGDVLIERVAEPSGL